MCNNLRTKNNVTICGQIHLYDNMRTNTFITICGQLHVYTNICGQLHLSTIADNYISNNLRGQINVLVYQYADKYILVFNNLQASVGRFTSSLTGMAHEGSTQ